MGRPLKNPPVYFTVAQVRFNALLKLADFLPAIQEGFRKDGFPAFATGSNVALEFNFQEGQPSAPKTVSYEQHFFGNVEQTHSFVLSREALTFQSTNYGTFEAFSGAFLKGLELVHQVVALDFTERVGLRYLDHVFPKDKEALEEYLAPQVHGLGSSLGGVPVHSYAESFSVFEPVKLRSRVVIQIGGLGFPSDLVPANMAVQERFLRQSGRHAILDNDGFVEGRQLFATDNVRQNLYAIHEVIGKAFKTTVTPHALTVWDE